MADSRPTTDRPADETIKETFESIVIAFILAFVFRAYVVEAFVIPTGSMAPTLLGAHIHVRCDQCGYEFDFDPPEEALQEVVVDAAGRHRVTRGYLTWPDGRHDAVGAVCPMCLFPNTLPRGTPVNSGDRILVHKYIYSFSEPRRWDVVVFKAPHEPETNYIKRLVGLPNERLYIFQGNIYVRPIGPVADPDTGGSGGWHIARKTDRPAVQRAVWQPIYHSGYIPLDGGRRSFASVFDWSVPWVAQGRSAGAWDLEHRRSYHFGGEGAGEIRFAFERTGVSSAALLYPYNQLQAQHGLEPIEDVRIAARIEPIDTPVGITFTTTARLDNAGLGYGPERLALGIAPTGEVTLEAIGLGGDGGRVLERARIDPLPIGRPTRVEFWYADQQASLWIDGDRVLAWGYELPLDALVHRPRPAAKPRISIRVTGPVNLHDVQVDRDLYYSNHLGDMTARAALIPGVDPGPLTLGPDDFFCLGDNGPRSSDGRYWRDANPWVRKRMLSERVAAGLDPAGVVPRHLMMGRAFFVYFPAPYSIGRIPLPNFGDMRFIR